MQLAENCLTDDGQRIRKGTPVFGEVTGIDGERVLVKITSVNLAGNILPFEKEVYSEDAMEGIYVPGNAKAETIKEAEAAGVSGTNMYFSFDLYGNRHEAVETKHKKNENNCSFHDRVDSLFYAAKLMKYF